MKTEFTHLFQPIQIGTLNLKNRIVMSGMCTNYGTAEGFVTERMQDYYEARAHGGVALVTVEAACVDDVGRGLINQLNINDDKFIPGLSELVKKVKKHGAMIAIQLVQAGAGAKSTFNNGIQPVGPSAVQKTGREIPRELSTIEVEEMVQCFANAAKRAREAGFDGVEVHAAHGYLISEFLSSYFNGRSDKYGGSLENRARFLIEIITAINDLLGKDYPVWFRINGQEYGPQAGLTSDEVQQIAIMAQEAGANAVDVSLSTGETILRAGPHTAQGRGVLVDLAAAVKKTVSIPVMSVGRMNAETGEKVLQEGKADLIVIGRGLIADPELPNKAASDRIDEIRPCNACLCCLEHVVFMDKPLQCVVNPAAGKEHEYSIAAAKTPKKVMVVGGGTAGMEAARVAALSGHHVTLYEKEKELGGQLLLAYIPPNKQNLKLFVEYQQRQLTKQTVAVELETEVDHVLIENEKPDALIIAAGANPLVPPIAGIQKKNVVLFSDVLRGNAEVGDKVVVIGGNQVGCETAEFLVEMGKEVTIIEILDELAQSVYPMNKHYLLARLYEQNIGFYAGVREEEITDTGIIITTKEGENKTIEAQTIVIAVGSRSNKATADVLNGKIEKTFVIGDCSAVRDIMSAVQEGYAAALKI
ncbi:MAG: FAD-dependent oxidoreductase [Syntrophaceae bacterium]|nr:FAD-dependent oxidoreductase [Syntrophaceae bacterium]